MATFLDICRGVRSRTGLQGTGPASVTTASGVEATLVQHVSDAWLDLQNLRTDWRWLRATATFLIDPATTERTPTQAIGLSPRFRKWKKETAYILVNGQWTPLMYKDYETFIFDTINIDVGQQPSYYTIREADSAFMYPLCNAQYSVKIDYTKSPQVLANNTDVPECPAYFHNLIMYAAIQSFSIYVGNFEVHDKYLNQSTILLKAFMREQLDRKVLKMRSLA